MVGTCLADGGSRVKELTLQAEPFVEALEVLEVRLWVLLVLVESRR